MGLFWGVSGFGDYSSPHVDPDESEFDSTHDEYDDEFEFDSTHDEYDDEYALDLGGHW